MNLSGSNQTGNIQFLQSTINPDCDVSGGTEQVSMNFKIPAGNLTDGSIVKLETILKGFTTDGVATETRKIVVDDGVLPLESELATGLAMPNNTTKFLLNVQSFEFLQRIGTHLFLMSNVASGKAFNTAINSGFDDGAYLSDLGEPDFANEINVSLTHLLNVVSVGAIIKCVYVEAKSIKI